ncbi:MAG TPA: hypothetical protein VFZ86_07095 [Thermoleophilia bacterium]|nr:hypothetical protein [Thermoleophilia bacterium]
MKVPLTWVWENDPHDLPDDDHARCIAAPGERFVACGGQLFALTTRPHARRSASRRAASFSTLQMEYLGLDWPRGLAQQYWGCEPFPSGPLDSGPLDSEPLAGDAQQAAGIALLATVAGALAAGSAMRSGSSSSSRVGFDDLRPPPRPPGWPPRRHARSAPRPALLPLTVGRSGDRR